MRSGGSYWGAGLVVLAVCLGTACNRDSEGQEAGRRDAELERKVEELLPRIEQLANLPVQRVPAVRRASSETLEAYLLGRLDAEYPGDTLENLALAYRFFGLLPDTVQLRQLLIDLLLEQAIGYYDPARDVFFVREQAAPGMLDPIIVHELVHALQDQQADLDSLIHSVRGNDARSAIQAALEGHATAAMLVYLYESMTGSTISVAELPELSLEMAEAIADPAAYPRLAEAPAIVREPLLFAYVGGARYLQRLWQSRPNRPPPFGEWLPESTEQLLHTERLLEERDSPLELGLEEPGDDWQVRYSADLGELELRIYFEQHLGDRPAAARAAAGWDGDAYSLLSRGGDLALVWYLAWDTASDAEEFVVAYREAFGARFGGGAEDGRLVGAGRQARVDALTLAQVPLVRVVETTPGVELQPPDLVMEPSRR